MLYGSNEPLYVVDDTMPAGSRIVFLNPYDIQKIEVEEPGRHACYSPGET
jgi:hypothetical protein